MSRILVCGGRDAKDAPWIRQSLSAHIHDGDVLIHGCALGIDSIADDWAKGRDVAVLRFRANWDKHGKAAGPIRNQQMLDEGKPDMVIAFPGGKGTENMVKLAKRAEIFTIFARESGDYDEA